MRKPPTRYSCSRGRWVTYRLFPRPLFARLNVKLTLGLLTGLVCVGVPFFFYFYHLHQEQLLEGLKSSTSSLSRLVVSSLQSAMLRETPHILQDEVTRLSQESGVERIMILDINGEVRVSSDARTLGVRYDRDEDPTCLVCHRLASPERHSTTVAESPSGEVFRNMNLILNEPRCHRCHDSSNRINGILVMDLSMTPARQQLSANMNRMLLVSGVMALLTVIVLWLLMNRLILSRLKRFTQVTGLIHEGQLDQEAPVDSGDEIGRLAESFNAMTASLRSSLEQLKHQRQFLENLINSIRDEIVVFGRAGNVVTANQAAREREGAQIASSLTRETFETEAPGELIEVITTRGGQKRHLEIHTYPLRNERGDVFLVMQVARDITERTSLEAHLHHSERLASLGLLASGFSHEINNPLACISVAMEGLVRKVKAGPVTTEDLSEMNEDLVLIRDEIERAKAITSRLLVLSRAPGGSPTLIDVGAIVSDTVNLLRYQAQQSEVEITESSEGDYPLVKGDEPALRQVFLNLLLNALEATESGGEIRTSLCPAKGGVDVYVQDNGNGIAPEDLKKIFEPFFSRNGKNGGGSGLGLFIATSIVNEMGGRIEVESGSDTGTTFAVHLPGA